MTRALAIFPADRIADALGVMREFAIDGAHGSSVQRLVLEAAREQRAGSFDATLAFRTIYGRLAERFTYKPDPYASEVIQAPHVTLAENAGDCDDATVLVLSVASALKLRGRMVVLSAETKPGVREALHVYAEVETRPGTWTCADLSERSALGACPDVPAATHVARYDVQGEAGPGLGFLDALFGAVTSIFSARENRKAAQEQTKAAHENRLGLENQADALRYQADRDLFARARESQAAERIANTTAKTQRFQTQAAERSVARVVDLVEDSLPTVAALAAIAVLAPVVADVLAPAATRRSRRAA